LAVKNFQKLVSIDTSGKLDKSTIAALNFPLEKRVEQIKESLNYWRWTGRVKEEEFILVNLPAARLQIVNRDSTHDMSMRVIVGKTGTQTPQFTSYVTSVITYPYWHVPYSIATKEMLPKIKRNPGYLAANELELLNNQGKVLDPYKINWSRVSPKNFKYKIRQSTGCDNALGVMKFDFNSPFSIYLHDTNRRDLFKNKDRFMSHGCVRVEKPMELAHYLLDEGLDSTTDSQT
jgi:murein L,D-transpeptidase YcbB/YkuD